MGYEKLATVKTWEESAACTESHVHCASTWHMGISLGAKSIREFCKSYECEQSTRGLKMSWETPYLLYIRGSRSGVGIFCQSAVSSSHLDLASVPWRIQKRSLVRLSNIYKLEKSRGHHSILFNSLLILARRASVLSSVIVWWNDIEPAGLHSSKHDVKLDTVHEPDKF